MALLPSYPGPRRDVWRRSDAPRAQALLLLIANALATTAAIIDGVNVPSGAGSREFIRIPSAWLQPVVADAS